MHYTTLANAGENRIPKQ